MHLDSSKGTLSTGLPSYNLDHSEAFSLKRGPGFVSSSTLLLIVFATAFFPRILSAIGAPSAVNFAHFIVLPIACSIVVLSSRSQGKHQLSIVKSVLTGLLCLFSIAIASAILNNAGVINVFLGLMILTEPFILLTALLSIPFREKSLARFRHWMIVFLIIHLALALGQHAAIISGLLSVTIMTTADNVQGVFYLSFGGHVVAACTSLAFGLYYYVSAKTVPLWVRISALIAVVGQILFADAKQVIFVAFIAWALLISSKLADIRAALKYIITALLLGYTLYWCVYNIDIDLFRAFQAWIRPEIYGSNGDATLLKTGPLRIIPTYYTSALHWLLGLGPGHTIGRIGGWMIRDYWNLVGRLGATTHPVSQEVWATWRGHYLDSSFFSPLWGWAGIWGDLGLLGIASYASLWGIVWIKVCKDDMSRFLLLNVVVNGFIFTLMEEPGFVLTSAMLIGLRWHELRLQRT